MRERGSIVNVANIKKLIEFDTPTVANGLGRLEMFDPSAGYTGPDVRALTPALGRRVGVAVTVRLDTTTPGTDNPPSQWDEWVHAMVDAGRRAETAGLPVFAVVESVGLRPRYTVTIGDGMGTVMKLAGAVACVSNGCMRDIEGVEQVGIACWGAGLSPMHGRMRWLGVQVPVVIDGMTVNPGDILHADVNGVLCIPAAVADKVYEQAVAVRDFEAEYFRKLRAPGMTIDRYFKEIA
jgi:4-hydroxy-4-methyl-2-oxoglutarate aldolase